ncbi:hypothetical protein M3Y94_00369200 [Aphelenchoides besseyi]|nr:hypothetical protein M3Y94_00369200 [Aphelenchoides besseyi]
MSSLSSSKFTIECLLSGQKNLSQLKSNDKSTERPATCDINRNGKSQRRRSTFTAIQVHVLESEFFKHRYVSPEKKSRLSCVLGPFTATGENLVSKSSLQKVKHDA